MTQDTLCLLATIFAIVLILLLGAIWKHRNSRDRDYDPNIPHGNCTVLCEYDPYVDVSPYCEKLTNNIEDGKWCCREHSAVIDFGRR